LSAGYYDAYYLKAQQVRTLLLQDYQRAFERVDVVATPTTPTPAFKLGEKTSDPVQMYLNDIFTRAFDEATLLRAADAYQRDTTFHTEAPPIA
jgi:aspartyl-tRNA(Asn)/glutamyl-tRNA(Gln) amidotransferase subunit A